MKTFPFIFNYLLNFLNSLLSTTFSLHQCVSAEGCPGSADFRIKRCVGVKYPHALRYGSETSFLGALSDEARGNFVVCSGIGGLQRGGSRGSGDDPGAENIHHRRNRNKPGAAVLEPAELTTLSFEVAGTLGQVSLNVGQELAAGDEIARIDPTSLELQVATAAAAVDQASSAAQNAADNYARQQELLERGSTTRVAVDGARTEAETSAAALEQAKKSLEQAEQTLAKSVLTAPYPGIVNTVDVRSFATVGAGTPVVSMYSTDRFEVSFSVNFDTVNALVVGKEASVRLADRPDIILDAVVSEIASRADAVSSFPVVLELRESHPLLKAGMAAEASIEFDLPVAEGYPVPITSIVKDNVGARATADSPAEMTVYVYDPADSTVKSRQVKVGGIRENQIIVIDGLSVGDRIASAGVSFLQDGQEVKLLDGEE
jgi:RND family efflux transporter MFP subunit